MKFSFILLLVLIGFASTSMIYAPMEKDKPLHIKKIEFGSITINGETFEKDVVIDDRKVRQRKKGPSKFKRGEYGHTPLTQHEEIPWDCDVLVIGIGMSSRLPVTDNFKAEAAKRGVLLVLLETPDAVAYLNENHHDRMNAIIHITC
jgi:hypothetical protein